MYEPEDPMGTAKPPEKPQPGGWRYTPPDDEEPPAGGPPIWLNPRFVIPAVALIVAAIVIRSVITNDPADDDDNQQAAPTTLVVTTTTPAPTTTTQPRVIPGGLRDFGGDLGLGEDELDELAGKLMPYDAPWYPTPANNPPDDHGPGLLSGTVATVAIPDDAKGPFAGVESGPWTVLVVVYEGVPLVTGPPGAFSQLGVGIGCGDEMPERSGPDGLGGAWDQLHFYGASGYTGPGFGYASGDTVVIGLPDVDACPYVVVSNFFRDMQGAAPAASDPAEYQWIDTLLMTY